MKLVRIHEYGGPEQLKYEDVEKPVAGAGQLLVRVNATSVNPVDWKMRSGSARALFDFPMPLVLGGDLAGVVEAVGDGVTGFAVGDEVFGLIGLVGAYAEYVAIDASSCAKKPSRLSFEEAAAIPLVALTAVQGFAATGVDLNGKTVLIHNAAGGVGNAAVQIAKAQGATVIATASAKNADFVRALGADEVVDFRETPIASHPRNVDVMMDLVGNAEALDLWPLVKQGGAVIRIAGGADAAALAEAGGIKAYKVRVLPNGTQLAQIAALVDAGKYQPHLATIMPLAQAAEAQELSRSGHVRGKIVLKMVH